MIAYCYIEEDGSINFTTTGCGCCNTTYYLTEHGDPKERTEIIRELKGNLKVLEEGLKLLGMTYDDLKEV